MRSGHIVPTRARHASPLRVTRLLGAAAHEPDDAVRRRLTPGRDRRRALAAPDGLGSRLEHEELPRTLWSRAHGPLDVLWPSQRALRALADLRDANDLVVVEAGQPALLRGELEAAHLTRRRAEPIREGLVRDRPGANPQGDLVHGEAIGRHLASNDHQPEA